MPQLRLEFSSNILEKNNLPDLFKQCHTILAENLPTSMESCKSRGIECDIFCVGDGLPNSAFIHVDLKVMPGRETNTLTDVVNKIMQLLQNYFSASLKELKLQITLELSELEKTYFKIAS